MDELDHLSASLHNFRLGIRRVCFVTLQFVGTCWNLPYLIS